MKKKTIDQSRLGVLLVSCPDRSGLIAATARLLADHQVNILNTDQHTDPHTGVFFQRLFFDADKLDLSRDDFRDLLRAELARYDMSWQLRFLNEKRRVAIYLSKAQHCIYDLLLRHRLGELDCDICLIIANHEELAREVHRQFDIPYHVFRKDSQNKRAQEKKELAILEREKIDLIVLARYMQILSSGFTDRFPNRIINIHHSTLPAFTGARPYHQAHERGVKLIGATAHYVTSALDEGPIIDQEYARCSHRDSVEDLITKGRDIEQVTLGRAVRAHLEDRIIVHGRKTVVF